MINIGDIISAKANSRTLAPAAVGTQAMLMTLISIVTLAVFSSLCTVRRDIYQPKVKYHVGKNPPQKINMLFVGWIRSLIRTKEPELLESLGLDAVTFLHFLRMLRLLFASIAALAVVILIPINVTYNLKNISPQDRDILSMMTIRDVGGNLLFAHVAMTYVITFVVMFFVWKYWKAMIQLRLQWFRTPDYLRSFYARTLMVKNVRKGDRTDEGIRKIIESLGDGNDEYQVTSVHIVRKVGELAKLIDEHNTTVRKLEGVLVRYLKGNKVAKERPTIRIGGLMGIGGVQKDAILFYTDVLSRTEVAVEECRKKINGSQAGENYGLASMSAVPYAHSIANLVRDKHHVGTKIRLAPHPKDIIWENLNISKWTVFGKKSIGFLLIIFVCFMNTIPLFIISVLANLVPLTASVSILKTWSDDSPASFAFVSGVLPPAVSALFGFFLPIIMRWFSRFQGAKTHFALDRAVIARYFAFLVISQLVIFTLIGVIFVSAKDVAQQVGSHQSFGEIIAQLSTLPATISYAFINQASYWLTFFLLRGFLAIFDLAQIANLLLAPFMTHIFGRTPRDIRELTKPLEFHYSILYSNILFMGAVAFVYAPIAPLVVAAGAVVFWISSFVYKYQLMYVFVSKADCSGRLWNVVVNRLLASVILMQALMTLTIGLHYKFRSLEWISTVPPIFFVVIFKFLLLRKFDKKFHSYELSQEDIKQAPVFSRKSDATMKKRFGHPAFHTELFTPMLHSKMMELLPEVYRGKISHEKIKVDGQDVEARIVPGGIKIAAIEEEYLELDPVIYQREQDQRELDSDESIDKPIFRKLFPDYKRLFSF